MASKSKKEIKQVKMTAVQIRDAMPAPTITPATKTVIVSLLTLGENKDDSGAAMVIRKRASHVVKNGSPDFEYLLGDNCTQISTLKREFTPDKTATIVFTILKNLSDSFNVSRGMPDSAIYSLAIDILEDLWSVRLEELIAFAYGLKKGQYIKVYERFDVSVFWEAWAVYEQSKESYIHNRHTDKKEIGFREDKPRDQLGEKLNGLISGFDAARYSTKK